MVSHKAEWLREMAEMYRHAAPDGNWLAYRIMLGRAFDLEDEAAKLERQAEALEAET